jgi:hypothetical protein
LILLSPIAAVHRSSDFTCACCSFHRPSLYTVAIPALSLLVSFTGPAASVHLLLFLLLSLLDLQSLAAAAFAHLNTVLTFTVYSIVALPCLLPQSTQSSNRCFLAYIPS